ncbi:hypothetical protein LEP3755_05140 [Leptolyngbya sp. NIES-3755]|nr:hypothetical protein LEP3755_05140 [Leptolyngbya sp. NIES-3755]
MDTVSQSLIYEEFIAQYGDDFRYELIDGQLRDRQSTGLHECVCGEVAGRVFVEIFRLNLERVIN